MAEFDLPCDERAERMLIAACFQSRDEFDAVSGWLRPEEFHFPFARFIWQAMLELASLSREITLPTVYDRLAGAGHEADVPLSLLAELSSQFSSHAATTFAELIRKSFLRRRLLETAIELRADALDPRPDSDPIETAERKIFALAESGRMAPEPILLSKLVDESLIEIDSRKSGKKAGMLPTGYSSIDRLIGGFEDSAFIIIAARPSVGKTAFALNLAAKMCRYGPVLFESLEQSRQELSERLLAREANVDSYRIKTGRMTAFEEGAIAEAGHRVKAMNWHVDDTGSQTATSIASTARRYKRRFGIRCVVIDYLQLVEPEEKRAARHEQVQLLTRRLKFMAREIRIPVIALAQLNREVENRPGGKPRLADLRESGAIEQDADVVMLLHEENRDNNDDPYAAKTLEVIVGKNRNGMRGSAILAFQKNTGRIEERATAPGTGGAEWMK